VIAMIAGPRFPDKPLLLADASSFAQSELVKISQLSKRGRPRWP
jgi:hypothetical protein